MTARPESHHERLRQDRVEHDHDQPRGRHQPGEQEHPRAQLRRRHGLRLERAHLHQRRLQKLLDRALQAARMVEQHEEDDADAEPGKAGQLG
jgi:hypothetical protein